MMFSKHLARVSTIVLSIAILILSGSTIDADEIELTKQEKSLLSDYVGDVVLPNELVRAYSQFVDAAAAANVEKIKSHMLPYSVKITTGARPEKQASYGTDMNIPFLQTGFHRQILNLRKETQNCYLVRTGSSYIHYVKTAANEWKIYNYGDKPIE